jgi:glutathione S-transferase
MLTIHGVPISVHTRKTIVAAIAKGVDFAVEPVIPFDPPANWEALSPTGLIPAMTDGDVTLPDSSVICAYLERTQPEPALYPKDTKGLMRALWLEEYCDGTVFPKLVHGLFFQTVIRPGMLGEETDVAEIERILGEVRPRLFTYLEGEMRGAFLVGTALTIADIALASNLINYRYLGFEIDEGQYPRMAAYLRTVLTHEPIAEALSRERSFAEQMGLDLGFMAERV